MQTQTQTDPLLTNILNNRQFIRTLAKAVIDELAEDGPPDSTSEELQQMRVDLMAGRIKAVPWREVIGDTHAV